MDKAEIVKLREFLRRSFGAPTLQVAPDSNSAEAADVSLGERKLGTITVDDEDGDRSFAFAMKVPVGRPVLQDYLRRRSGRLDLHPANGDSRRRSRRRGIGNAALFPRRPPANPAGRRPLLDR